jgi:hypothetical protein
MASIYREGKGWAVRVRTSLHRRYKSGFRTHAEAREWARETESAIAKTKQPSGPQRSKPHWPRRRVRRGFSVQKRCVQEVVRQPLFACAAAASQSDPQARRHGRGHPRWSSRSRNDRRASQNRCHVRSQHTGRRFAARPRSTAASRRFATLPVARIAAYDVNELVKAMLGEGYAPATIRIELALLSALFKTTEVWEWGKLPNVAHAVRWPSARGSAAIAR